MAADTTRHETMVGFDLSKAWQLHPRVALRPEPFGALAYHYDNRRLNFVRSPDLVRVLESLQNYPTAADALTNCGVARSSWPAFGSALQSLFRSDFIQLQPATD